MNSPSGVERSTQTDLFRLPGGESVMVRAISPQDADRLQAYMRNLSGLTRRNRFLGAVSELTPKELERLTHMGGPGELALIVFGRVGAQTAMIAEAIQAIAPQSQRCEIALSVTDAWQRKGLGTLLLSHMECRARPRRASPSAAPSRTRGSSRSSRIFRVRRPGCHAASNSPRRS